MANHRKKHTSRRWRGCAMCKWYKARGQNADHYSHVGDARRAESADEQLREAA